MTNFISELLSGYYMTGVGKFVETFMILFLVAWIVWCVKLMMEPDDGVMPEDPEQ